MVAILLAAAVQAATVGVQGARTPASSSDGQLAVSVAGDLWLVPAGGGEAVRLTTGSAWDRDPAWTPDGGSLVFASDRMGSMDIWRIRVGPAGATGEPEAVTRGPAVDTEPTVMPDGAVVFVRGVSAAADLWSITADGSEARLTDEPGADRSPAASRSGAVAWVAERSNGTLLRIRSSPGGPARDVVTDLSPTRLAWSPDGSFLAFGSAGRQTGVWVTQADGRYVVPAAETEGSPAWSPDGRWLYIAASSGPDVGYNGDPDRLSGRTGGDASEAVGGLTRVRAPSLPTAPESVSAAFNLPRRDLNAAAFDRVWARTARLYLGWTGQTSDSARTAGLRAWRDAARRHRPLALAAGSATELDSAIDGLLASRPATRTSAQGRAAVSSAHPLATAAGIEILEAGGNVVDAAVAVSFALGVVEPDASGPGGYGEMLIHLAGMEEPTSIEFMTRVPEGATADNPALQDMPADGPMRVNVPGTVAGMEKAWREHGSGKVTWKRILQPAIRIASQGFVIDDGFATTLRREWLAFAQYESSRNLFFRDGRPLQEGDTLRNPDLARTLSSIADGGAEAFYRGDIARTLVNDLSAAGNPISLSDMATYTAAERRPVRTTYRGNAVYSGPPPVTGGVSLVGKLNLLELAPAGSSITNDPAKLHAMIEAWKLQPSTGGRIGDPDTRDVDVSPFESKDTARARWACFDPDRAGDGAPDEVSACVATPAGRAGGVPPMGQSDGVDALSPGLVPCVADGDPRTCRSTGTTAFAVADADGNLVAVTQTLGTWGGNFYVTPGLGFLYNDKLTGARPGGRGGPVPLSRVGTVIAPTLVFEGDGPAKRPLMALGAAGNAWITSAVYEIVVGVLDHRLDPQAALEQPRFLPGGRGAIQIEDAFPAATIRQLEAMGHEFRRISMRGELRMGYGAVVLIRDGRVIAGADPRRSGAAAAVR